MHRCMFVFLLTTSTDLAPNETVQWLWQCERDAFLIGMIKVKLKTVSKYDVLISDKASLHINIVYLYSHNQ